MSLENEEAKPRMTPIIQKMLAHSVSVTTRVNLPTYDTSKKDERALFRNTFRTQFFTVFQAIAMRQNLPSIPGRANRFPGFKILP
jgi:hypothetical protein